MYAVSYAHVAVRPYVFQTCQTRSKVCPLKCPVGPVFHSYAAVVQNFSSLIRLDELAVMLFIFDILGIKDGFNGYFTSP